MFGWGVVWSVGEGGICMVILLHTNRCMAFLGEWSQNQNQNRYDMV